MLNNTNFAVVSALSIEISLLVDVAAAGSAAWSTSPLPFLRVRLTLVAVFIFNLLFADV